MTKTPAKTHGPEYERFGKNLASLRSQLGLSQSEMAERFNMTQSTYAGYETGTRKIPLSLIIQMSKFFRVPADKLIEVDYVLHDPVIGDIHMETYRTSKSPDISDKLMHNFNQLNDEGKQRLIERSEELVNLGFIGKGDSEKMA